MSGDRAERLNKSVFEEELKQFEQEREVIRARAEHMSRGMPAISLAHRINQFYIDCEDKNLGKEVSLGYTIGAIHSDGSASFGGLSSMAELEVGDIMVYLTSKGGVEVDRADRDGPSQLSRSRQISEGEFKFTGDGVKIELSFATLGGVYSKDETVRLDGPRRTVDLGRIIGVREDGYVAIISPEWDTWNAEETANENPPAKYIEPGTQRYQEIVNLLQLWNEVARDERRMKEEGESES
jgi:hypothetical protein